MFFFLTYFYIHASNTLFIDDTLYKNIFNNPYNAIFLKSFNNLRKEDQYLLGFVLPYYKIKYVNKLV